MSLDRDWDSIRPSASRAEAGISILRITLLFGSAAVALALIVAPFLDRQTQTLYARDGLVGIDTMSTGSIGKRNIYTIRRSVLQDSPNAVCVIRENGSRSGDC